MSSSEGSKGATKAHIKRVEELLLGCIEDLLFRSQEHDKSKLEDPELSIFDEYTPKLKDCTYGSDEYKGFLEGMKPALDHHYAENRHHPEHLGDIHKMNLIDLLEMVCDWKAASERHADGDVYKSICVNADRFGYGEGLHSILISTADYLSGK